MPETTLAETPKTIRITLVKSPIGFEKSQKATVKALGLRKLHQTVEKADTPAIRGMIQKVSHLVAVASSDK
jgi:large subunit ribosomal protein L30